MRREYYCPLCGNKINFPAESYDNDRFIRDDVICPHCGTFFALCGDVNPAHSEDVIHENYSLIWDVVKNA